MPVTADSAILVHIVQAQPAAEAVTPPVTLPEDYAGHRYVCLADGLANGLILLLPSTWLVCNTITKLYACGGKLYVGLCFGIYQHDPWSMSVNGMPVYRLTEERVFDTNTQPPDITNLGQCWN